MFGLYAGPREMDLCVGRIGRPTLRCMLVQIDKNATLTRLAGRISRFDPDSWLSLKLKCNSKVLLKAKSFRISGI